MVRPCLVEVREDEELLDVGGAGLVCSCVAREERRVGDGIEMSKRSLEESVRRLSR